MDSKNVNPELAKWIEDPHAGVKCTVLEIKLNDKWYPYEIMEDVGDLVWQKLYGYCDNHHCATPEIEDEVGGCYANFPSNPESGTVLCGNCDWEWRLGVADSKVGECRSTGEPVELVSGDDCEDTDVSVDDETEFRLRRTDLGPFSEKFKQWCYDNADELVAEKDEEFDGLNSAYDDEDSISIEDD